MQFRFLNKNIQNRRFDFAPRYFDERREKLELKKKQFERLKNNDLTPEERQQLLRNSMRESWSGGQYRTKANYAANMRTVLLIAVLLGLGYLIFSVLDDVNTVVKKLM